ncbi:MAG: DUF1786 family protein [Candidatus Hodarchaeales archaeon]|jgi:uncharacterized protein (DUF1786 family)
MKLLAIDIGAGTEDLLLVDTERSLENAIQRVIPSASARFEKLVIRANKDVFCYGGIIGGHPFVHGLEKIKKAGCQAVFTETAALSLRYDLNAVKSWGFSVIEDQSPQVAELRSDPEVLSIELADVDFPRLHQFLAECQVSPSEIAVVLLCAQDHGLHAPGEKAREVRFKAYRQYLEKDGKLTSMLYGENEVPEVFPRLASNLELIQEHFPTTKGHFVMDSSPAILLGACLEHRNAGQSKTIINLGNGHTVVATLDETAEVQALCEHHTGQLRKGRLDEFLRAFFAEELTAEQMLREGGHGVIYRKGFSAGMPDELLVVGPRRGLMTSSRFPFRFISPLGLSMMMAGPLGMITAYEERTGESILEQML